MHKDPDTYQKDNEISCSDYRFVYMGAKGLSVDIVKPIFSLLDMDTFNLLLVFLV